MILQVPSDANLKIHSPFFNNHFDILMEVYQNIPSNYQLVVREHPLYKKKYSKKLYEFLLKKDIFLDDRLLSNSISYSSLIIVNNSTVGFEALFNNKKVVALGDSYYDEILNVYKLRNEISLSELIRTALRSSNHNSNKDCRDFLNCNFFEGHFRDKTITIEKRLLKKLIHD